MKIRIRKTLENAILPVSHKGGCWLDTYVARIGCVDIDALESGKPFSFNDITWYPNGLTYCEGDVIVIDLGFAMELPEGKEGYLLPRSSTFKNTGLMLTNSQGIIDTNYCGDSDSWLGMFYATREGHVDLGDRLLQMRVQDAMPQIEFEEVEHLNNENRSGYGSSGR